ncbi:hypothetical protein DTO164E3_2972 [Paecilomyces variotii]|nr:hypothetical protein DTO164E3_2972 [Paecilomyces variotii]KAJ9209101.1 hypothetical protein DTO032I3_318 [Paecilomyces variotii]KAJ9282981.1 hypothetical protein DTO021D3_318 [Paecilomyces variotii]KAJ9343815.1 hypothetical protein DTO027B6_3640 [Paecilomyces variotii]KAJ9386982.1 hypothetical protein DTO032I4_3426 [Paecilomyces variotii]
MEPPAKKPRTLLDDSSSESEGESGGVRLNGDKATGEPVLKINEEYARRFEYNKKREEKQQLEAKLGKSVAFSKKRAHDDDDEDASGGSDESSSEEEDEDGELVTPDLDNEIMATLNAIKSKDPRVYDSNVTFYSKFDEDASGKPAEKKEKDKPMTLRDYHRENLLKGVANGEEEEEQAPKSFAQEQEDLKKTIVKEMHAVADGSDDEDDGFLVQKSVTRPPPEPKKNIELDVENADKDPETFLSNFMAAKAWIPAGGSNGLKPFESDDEEEDQRAELFEEAYNFRFEDPNKVNERLITHARDATKEISVRREEKSSRKKRREAEQQKREEEKKQREAEKNRLRKLKMEELEEKVNKIKQAAGIRASEFTDEDWARFLDDNFDDKQWEEEMQKRFGEDYYAAQEEIESGDEDGHKKKRKPKKPTWDDDIDITDLVPDFEEEEEKPDVDMDEEDGEEGSKKSKGQERREKKREARKEKMLIEEAVDRNLDLDPTLLPGATKKNAGRFRYRETSPTSFGLTARDILMADDAQLNQFAGLKKLAPFRDPEKKRRDQKKLGKKARVRQWRKETFGDEEGPKWEIPVHEPAPQKEGNDDEMKVDIREGGSKKKRKRSKKH